MREQQEKEEAKGLHQALVLPRIPTKDTSSQPQLVGIYGRDDSGSREKDLVRIPSS